MSPKAVKTKAIAKLSFKPKQVTKRLLSALIPRARDIITKRYGLGADTKPMTLEAIGNKYSITRERVRQIDAYSIAQIRKSKDFAKEEATFEELRQTVRSMGGIMTHGDLLEHLSKDKSNQNHLHFLLLLDAQFVKGKENDHIKHHWHVDKALAQKIESSLRKLYENLDDDDLIPESEMIKDFLDHLEDVSDEYRDEEVVRRWLNLSHRIDRNPLGEWGRSTSSNVNAKGVRDFAFLVIRKHGSPIHFREVAKAIGDHFDRRAHVATTHNELIKDSRFVLVGRGLYALKEWGYMPGVVKDVIANIIRKHGPMTKDKVVEKVLKERYVKENTILVNLQNPKYFKRDKEGKYSIVE